MAYWTGTEVVHRPDEPYEGAPGWIRRDCHCCNGIQWGGDEPYDCGSCAGIGSYAVHAASGTVAQYPGGPFLGAHEKP